MQKNYRLIRRMGLILFGGFCVYLGQLVYPFLYNHVRILLGKQVLYDPIDGKLTLQVVPLEKYNTEHYFPIVMSHIHHCKTYDITIANYNIKTPADAAILIFPTKGTLIGIRVPYQLQAKTNDESCLVKKTWDEDGPDNGVLFFSIKLPEAGTKFVISVVVQNKECEVPDESLRVQLSCPGRFFDAYGAKGNWATQEKNNTNKN